MVSAASQQYGRSGATAAAAADVVWGGGGLLGRRAGIGVTSTGHCHPTVVKAVQEQAANVVHAQQNVIGAHEKGVSARSRIVSFLGWLCIRPCGSITITMSC